MKVKVLVDIVFEYGGVKKTMFKSGTIFTDAFPAFEYVFNPILQRSEQTNTVVGYWIGSERGPKPAPPCDAPGSLIQTKCFLHECEVLS